MPPPFGTQLKEGFGAFSSKAFTSRLLSADSKTLTVSFHSFLYSIWIEYKAHRGICQEAYRSFLNLYKL